MKVAMKRWVCPECNAGINAPSRLRKIDVRRYCLKCSAKKGVLVERIAPALEKKRQVSRQRSTVKQARKRAKVSAKKQVVKQADREFRNGAGFNLDREAAILWRLFVKRNPRLSKRTPGIQPKMRNRYNGSAYAHIGRGFVRMSQSRDRIGQWCLLLHELAHFAEPPIHIRGRKKRVSHHHDFYIAMRDVIRMRLKVDVSLYGVTRWGYAVDSLMERQLRDIFLGPRPVVEEDDDEDEDERSTAELEAA